MNHLIQIGDRVTLNDNVAHPFVGKSGVVTAQKPNPCGPGVVYVVRLDTPTAPAQYWTPLETLGVGSHCLA